MIDLNKLKGAVALDDNWYFPEWSWNTFNWCMAGATGEGRWKHLYGKILSKQQLEILIKQPTYDYLRFSYL